MADCVQHKHEIHQQYRLVFVVIGNEKHYRAYVLFCGSQNMCRSAQLLLYIDFVTFSIYKCMSVVLLLLANTIYLFIENKLNNIPMKARSTDSTTQ